MAAIDLASIMDAVNQQNGIVGDLASNAMSVYSKINNIGNAGVESFKQEADSAMVVTMADEQAKLRAQQNSRMAATKLGTNMDDQGELITQLSDQIRTSYDSANKALDTINQKESVGLFDDPLTYISNQLSIDGDYAAYDGNKKKYELATEMYNQINSLTQQSSITQNAIAENRTDASLAARAKQLSAVADRQTGELESKNLLTNLQGQEFISKLSGEQLDNLVKAKSMQNADEQLAISKANYTLSAKTAQIAFEERDLKLAEKKRTLEEEAAFVDTINTGRKAEGFSPITQADISNGIKLGGTMKDNITQWYTVGSGVVSSGNILYGSTPANANERLLQTRAPLAQQYKPIVDQLNSIRSQVIKEAVTAGTKPTKELIEAKVNEKFKALTTSQASRIRTGDDVNNLFYAPDMKSLSATEAVQKTQLYKDVLGPAIESSTLPVQTNPDLILAVARDNIRSGKITLNQASSDIATIFKQAVVTRDELRGFNRFGIIPPTGYNAELSYTGSGFLSTHSTVDLTDTKAVTLALSKQLSSNLDKGRTAAMFDKNLFPSYPPKASK